MSSCPVCRKWLNNDLRNSGINRHIDECLNTTFLQEEDAHKHPHLGAAAPDANTQHPTDGTSVDTNVVSIIANAHGDAQQSNTSSTNEAATQPPPLRGEGEEDPSTGGALSVSCPFPLCHSVLEESHSTFCPVCKLQGEALPPSNLIEHLTTSHGELLQPEVVVPELGSGYVERTLDAPAGAECSICLATLYTNDVVATLDCFCMFHKECINNWFAKHGARSCPLHEAH
ncbi:hypothetical protein Pelo_11198 [Pelomyxa schiedti]|nr:hypothetical protein Pelo_11198 [Pelomyxa schiedti]